MKHLGKRIKQARHLMGYTQEELAEYIGVSRASIARIESGIMEPRLQNLVAISKTLHVSVDYLLGIEKTDTRISERLSDDAIEALDLFLMQITQQMNDKK